jgi:uncharacterized protein
MQISTKSKREEIIMIETLGILKRYINPGRIVLFGSRAKGTNTLGSDFDFAVDTKKPQLKIIRKITEEIDKMCGLYSIDIVYLKSVDDGFKNLILKQGKVVYERRN